MSNESGAKGRAVWLAKVVYGVCCVAILVTTFYRSDPLGEVADFGWTEPMWGMVLLSFPCGFAALLAARAVLYVFVLASDTVASTSLVWGEVVFQWAALFAGGYLQWFWLMPRLVRRWGR